MALTKQSLPINFTQGLDTKTDPWQVQPGRFLYLQNSIFTKGGLLQKRNGFQELPSVNNVPSFVSTYAGNLVSIGKSLQVLSQQTNTWNNRGSIQPVSLDVLSSVRMSANLVECDSAVSSNGLACVVSTDSNGVCYYQVIDATSGQIFVSQTSIAGSTSVRAFSLPNFLVVVFLRLVGSTPHLSYISIPVSNPTNVSAIVDVSTSVKTDSTGYDGISVGGNLYLAWNGSDSGGAIRLTFLDSQLNQHSVLVVAGHTSSLMSLAVDSTGTAPVLWASFWDSSDNNGYSASFSVSNQLQSLLAPALIINDIVIAQITSFAVNNVVTVFYETVNNYPSPNSSTRSDYVSSLMCTGAGSVSGTTIILRGVGIVGKAFYYSTTSLGYLLVSYGGVLNPVNFLIDQNGKVIGKLAYENSGGYAASQVLANANLFGNEVTYSYLYKFLAVPVNKAQGVGSNPIYGEAGVNLATFSINAVGSTSQEIAGALHITGGFLWFYDGNIPVEFDFHVFPEDVGITTATGSGDLIAQQYYYYVVYAWLDSAGNYHRSAPSIAYGQLTTTGSSTNTLVIPTYRQTYKTAPKSVIIEIYRWSTAQEVPYLITSETSPILNNTAVDTITYVDSASDADILGNQILYTEGGIVEDVAPPACSVSTLYRARMFLVDAEDQNLIWFSKVVIESVPVEFSDLLTYYVAPTFAAQGSTGPITALAAMDSYLIIWKKNAIYYITGDGPDNTGANSDYGDPVFISGTAGCTNPQSIVLTPKGLMFQSDKGIWLLGRDLSTTYIGAAVEQYNTNDVLSAVVVPGTNQVRFDLDNGIKLMYDYFYDAWGTFVGVGGISSTIYNNLHTFLNSLGQVLQENPGNYLDGSRPVLLSFTTSWFNVAGLQGYQRAYFFFLIGQYLSPHKLQIQIAYDYSPNPSQQIIITPDNYAGVYGQQSPYGNQTPYGGPSQLEQWRIFFQQQTCESFQLTISELYDPSFGVQAGAGLTLSGLNLIFGVKNRYPRVAPSRQAG